MSPSQTQDVIVIIGSIRSLSDEVAEKLAALPSAKSKVVVTLDKLDNFLCSIAGEKPRLRPASKKFGPIETPVVELPAAEPKSQRELEVEAMVAEADAILVDFVDRDTDEMLDAVTDNVIRIVAKKVGLHVTEDDPEKIDAPFIESIKAKIKEDKGFTELTGTAVQSAEAETNQRISDLTVVKEEFEKMIAEATAAKAESKDKSEKKELTDRIKQLEADLAETIAEINLLQQSQSV